MEINNKIAFQGIYGANSDLACRQLHPYMETVSYASFDSLFDAVAGKEVALGMIPVENSQAGRVSEIHQLLPNKNVHIVGEYFQKIEHYLLSVKGAKLSDIKEIYSHPQALMQCREYIDNLGPNVTAHAASNTAVAAADILRLGDKSKAAIASKLAANLYDLDIIDSNIEDSEENFTVFAAIASEPIDPDPKDGVVVTSLLFSARNIPASLYKSLGGFATNQVNLLKIESYIPSGISKNAQFFINFVGHPQNRNVQLAIEELGFFSKNVKLLGVYHAAKERNL
ncbi:MAG: prephenate dehydratase domain-containing protein [Pseudomonadota bacterium]